MLDFTWVMAGPWSSRVLADYGATVIKVESGTRLDLVRILGPFYGDKFSTETSASFASINAGKHSLAVDPGTPEGKATDSRTGRLGRHRDGVVFAQGDEEVGARLRVAFGAQAEPRSC